MTDLTMGSLFDGSGGFPLGALLSGITPVWASEIEPFPIRVTTKRLPFMKHYGDINKLNGAEIEPVDIITFGSPCTNMSVAGKREGLNGEQSVLFYQAIRIIKEMRCATNGRCPRFIVWENVPGAYSSAGGGDFREVLSEIVKIKDEGLSVLMPESGKWLSAGEIVGDDFSVAWRTLDAQFWGVAQRRRRCYLVADFTGGCAGKILFESEGVSGYSPQSFSPWQGAACYAEGCLGETDRTVLNDQGGSRMDITSDITSTLRAEAHHPPCVLESAGFCTEHSAQSRGVGYEKEKSPTLRAGVVPGVAIENHAQDSRVKISEDGIVQTLAGNMGMGGGNVPLVMNERQYAMTVDSETANSLMSSDYKGVQCVCQPTPQTLKIRSGCEGGGKGALIQEDKSATLSCNNDQTVFVPFCKGTRPHNKDEGQNWKAAETANTLNTFDTGETRCNELAVKAYGICSDASNSMRSDNPNSGIYEADTSRTLDGNGGNPSCNQGGMAVVALQGSMIGREDKNGPMGSGVNDEVCFTLNTIDKHAVAYDCRNHAASDISATLQSKNNGGQSLNFINPVMQAGAEYTVRRLVPKECAMLQGFDPDWCANLETSEPIEADIAWWSEIFETHRKIMGTSGKPKSRRQIIKWLKNPHSDAAEYKMWGNGVALPCVRFVMAGIVWAVNELSSESVVT